LLFRTFTRFVQVFTAKRGTGRTIAAGLGASQPPLK
jgi:hypothetical protein